MAIFGSKKNKKETAPKAAVKRPAPKSDAPLKPAKSTSKKLFGVLKNPRITEKATFVSEKNVYTFDVSLNSNEQMVKQAVKETYGVTPLKVNLLNIRGKKFYSRGKDGTTAASKKAYVYLKAGDKIEFA